MKAGSKAFYRLTKPVVFALCLSPFAYLLAQLFGWMGASLGANPVEALLHELGVWGLRFLLLSLAITPLRRWTGLNWLIRFRRMLGLFAFFYVVLHFLVYAVLDQGLDFGAIIEDIIKRPYITLGMTALLLLMPLAATSTLAMMRRLGKNWQKLHRLVYVIGVLAVWHFYWQVKLDTLEASLYVLILVVLLFTRIYYARRNNARRDLQAKPVNS
jgi:sulfoxide reductase heme-binding subunit YedZ